MYARIINPTKLQRTSQKVDSRPAVRRRGKARVTHWHMCSKNRNGLNLNRTAQTDIEGVYVLVNLVLGASITFKWHAVTGYLNPA